MGAGGDPTAPERVCAQFARELAEVAGIV